MKPFGSSVIRESLKVSLDVLKVVLPIIIAVEAIKYFGLVDGLGRVLDPLMQSLGLPGAFGIVWATAIVTHLYAAVGAFVLIAPDYHLTVAQVTVLGAVMLVAHSLPLEIRIAQRAGGRWWLLLALRLAGAYLYGIALHLLFSTADWLAHEAVVSWPVPQTSTRNWGDWALEQALMMLTIFFAVFALILAMTSLEHSGIKGRIASFLAPAMRIVGIGKEASSIAVVGGLLGMVYGGALIISEARAGSAPGRDTFLCLVFMGLFHSAIEDTLLMMAIGGSIWGLLVGRLIFALVVTYLFCLLTRRYSDIGFGRYFFRIESQTARD